MRRLAVLVCLALVVPAVPAATASPTAAAAKKAKKCKKGYERKRVKVGKRRVARCVKKKSKARPKQTPAVPGAPGAPQTPGAPVPPPATGPAAPTPEQTNAQWRQLVVGSSFTWSTYSPTSGNTSKTVFSFCSDGASFRYYYEFVGQVTNEYKQRQGTYTLNRTLAGTEGGGQWVDGLIDYQSNIEEKPAGQAVVRVYADNPSKAYINSGDGAQEYTRQPGNAGC